MLTRNSLKRIIKEELKRFYKGPEKGIHLGSKSGRFIVYFYNADCPKGGKWAKAKDLPGREDIKGSMDSPKMYMSFAMDYGQKMADLENEKAGQMKYKPEDFTYDSIFAIDTESGDIFGPIPNFAMSEEPWIGKATRCAGDKKEKPSDKDYPTPEEKTGADTPKAMKKADPEKTAANPSIRNLGRKRTKE